MHTDIHVVVLQITQLMDQFERQFEHLDVQTQTMDEAMSGATTLTVPEVYCTCMCMLCVHMILCVNEPSFFSVYVLFDVCVIQNNYVS